MRDNIIIGLLAVTLLLTGINTYLVTQNSSAPNLQPSDEQSSNVNKGVKPQGNASSKDGNNKRIETQVSQGRDQNSGNSTINNMTGTKNTTSIKFNKNMHDFGNIKSTSENKYNFKFTNTGDAPLIISNAKGSCGCTVPSYPKHPIQPGATEEIEVIYSPKNQSGPQTKRVTITANTKPQKTVLTIKGDVEKVGAQG